MSSPIIGWGHGLAPVQRQAMTETNIDLSSTGAIGTNNSEIRKKFLPRK